ncbi:MAG: peptidylprolyl isomerase [Caldilineales bacterium]|nr:peptidylprolyl isomerase [Caldilineales bacterium]MDW8317822.1 peptidylprolyl isomerase [Anaerolineae bacterium]
MTTQPLTVRDGMVVTLDYTLRRENGEIIDTSVGREALEYLQGAGQIIPGLEQALYGMVVGEERRVVVAPEDAYGEVDPEAVHLIPHSAFPPGMEVEPGMVLQVRNQYGEVSQAWVADVQPEGVVLDFNHPLAGMTLYFDAKIVGLRPATPEELIHGHVHGAGGHEH